VVFEAEAETVVVDVTLRRRRLECPECLFNTTALRHPAGVSRWRHTDMGRWKVLVRAGLRRLVVRPNGVRVEAVPFARYRTGFSRDFEDLVAFLATKTDKTTISELEELFSVPDAGHERELSVATHSHESFALSRSWQGHLLAGRRSGPSPQAERSPAHQQTNPNRTGPKSSPTPGVSRKTGSVVRPGEGGLTGILDR
jgi:hypothetical protein